MRGEGDEGSICPACQKLCELYEGASEERPVIWYLATACCDAIYAMIPAALGDDDDDGEIDNNGESPAEGSEGDGGV